MEKEFKLFRRFDFVKRLLVLLFFLYVLAAMSSTDTRAALPGLEEVCTFYNKLVRAVITVWTSGGR